MSRILALARDPIVRTVFVVAALGLAAWAVARDRASVGDALSGLDPALAVLAVVASFANVLAGMGSWRAVMADLGSPLGVRDSSEVFLVSQVAKYLPGGVWNIVAGAELARDRGVSRIRAASAIVMTMLVSALVGAGLAGVGAVALPHGLPGWVRSLGVLAPVAAILLVPRVLTRLLAFALRLVRRPDRSATFTSIGVARASAWAFVGWVFAGVQVWLLGVGLGLDATPTTFAVATCGFAAAWVVGFAVLPLPAGLGARELVLYPVFAAFLDPGAVLVLVLASRVLFTVADGGCAVAALVLRRRR